jgi:hypothetical protein
VVGQASVCQRIFPQPIREKVPWDVRSHGFLAEFAMWDGPLARRLVRFKERLRAIIWPLGRKPGNHRPSVALL